MIIAAGFVLGAALGWMTARKKGGNSFDKWQYAIVYAILFSILGLFATLFIDRMT
ncbi:hypothetical protein OEW28_08250 [Defluviimonas sp. WL0002]|uniref:Apolipoprotein acyltransferase n=1 Tax=Albidovulum marisflavi TaxID=2984159 RepID=A0ABT2ZBU7_9RHOB|nr:hypothetical protein [Defluviimonas sp. WL0002]MCV2868618.1 hypothetical protein [Defluviimonas sp. WL0002]